VIGCRPFEKTVIGWGFALSRIVKALCGRSVTSRPSALATVAKTATVRLATLNVGACCMVADD
jgi:hypothetical protein